MTLHYLKGREEKNLKGKKKNQSETQTKECNNKDDFLFQSIPRTEEGIFFSKYSKKGIFQSIARGENRDKMEK